MYNRIGVEGEASNGCNITACWSTADATASSSAGCFTGGSSSTTFTACYWGNTTTAAGIGSSSLDDTGEAIHVDGNNWSIAMEAMNNALANSGYRWTENTGSDADDVPLVLVGE